MANNQNLKPVKPGQVLNPTGRPKGSQNRSTIVKKWGQTKVNVNALDDDQKKLNVTAMDGVILKLYSEALAGNISAIKEILDSSFGKNKDDVDVFVEGEVKVSNVIDMSKWK